MIEKIDFTGLKFLPGCSAGLDEQTAVFDMAWTGQLEPHVNWAPRLTKHLVELRLGDPLWGFSAPRLPAEFVVNGNSPDLSAFPFWVVALAIALQRWARQPVWQGAVLTSGHNVARLAVPYACRDVLPGALEHAARLLIVWSKGSTPSVESKEVREALDEWLMSVQAVGWAPETLRFFALARRRGIPTTYHGDMLQLGQCRYAEYLDSNFNGSTSGLALLLARNKHLTNHILSRAGIPVPSQWVVATQDAAEKAAQRLNWPVVIKHGHREHRALPRVCDLVALQSAFGDANRHSPGRVIVEKYVVGERYKLLVVGGMLRMATQRAAGWVNGDDDASDADMTALVHSDHRAIAEAAARAAGLHVAEVEFLCPDISRAWLEVGGVVCEINAQSGSPSLWMSTSVRNINGEVMSWLYQNKPARIPTVVVAGAQGETTAVYMLHHIWRMAGKTSGMCTAYGTWVGEELVSGEESSGFSGVRLLLENPAVEAALIELSGDWPLEFGHPCDGYDVIVVPNLLCTPTGIDGSPSTGQATQMLVELLSRARDAVVLNADDPGCVALLEHVAPEARLLLIASDAQNHALVAHRERGGEALLLESRASETWAIHAAGRTEKQLMRLPIALTTSNGSNETNTLIALAVSGLQGVSWASACAAMASFYQVPEALVA